jgi:hypothetical protein
MHNKQKFSKRIVEALQSRREVQQWETLIVEMLGKLELSPFERMRATQCYEQLGQHIARKMGLAQTDAQVFVQGSMRTQTTVSPRGNQKFDLDVVVKLANRGVARQPDAEAFFSAFGIALKGVSNAGEPEPKRRCWRLNYPNESFYFDVTPALPDSSDFVETDLRVRDPDTVWSPSNPEEFAEWFCGIASKRFAFRTAEHVRFAEANSEIVPLPSQPVGIYDVLRRGIQLMKLHRDNYYWEKTGRKEAMPISVILVTLAGHAYNQLVTAERTSFDSPMEALLELVDRMPNWIRRNGLEYHIPNPKLPSENFADKWNRDAGARAKEFSAWHQQLKDDLEVLFSEGYDKRTEPRVRSVFGQFGVDAWKASRSDALKGLLTTIPGQSQCNPMAPRAQGSSHTLA